MSRSILFIIMCLTFSLLSKPLFAQETLQDVVYLKDGSVVRGTIVEQIPGISIKIRTNDGSEFVYKMDLISRITKEAPRHPNQNRHDRLTETPRTSLISLNPIGFVAPSGIAWIGYERHLAPQWTLQARLDYVQYEDRWEEYSEKYDETGNGFGAGITIRGFLPSSHAFGGFFAAVAWDVVQVSWKWDDLEKFATYNPKKSGSGSTTSAIFTSQVGYSIPISQFRIIPALGVSYVQAIGGDTRDSFDGFIFMPTIDFGLEF
jgi:hypothetical protein